MVAAGAVAIKNTFSVERKGSMMESRVVHALDMIDKG